VPSVGRQSRFPNHSMASLNREAAALTWAGG
jgi:hypothetical protein